MPKDRWVHVFARWSGWINEDGSSFRVSTVAHSGKHSLLMVGGANDLHDATGVKLLHKARGDWAFYNGSIAGPTVSSCTRPPMSTA